MASEQLQRTTYLDPENNNKPRENDYPSLEENERDMDEYYRPLERIHGSSLHGWGVASGLNVTATLNSDTLTVQPGVALDSSGRHISLAVGDKNNAVVGPNQPTGFSNKDNLKSVPASGVVLLTSDLTSALTGDEYLTIQFWETFDYASRHPAKDQIPQFIDLHTPWLRLQDKKGFTNDGSQLVLAEVSLADGKITALSQGLRQATYLPVGSIQLQRIETSSSGNEITVGNTTVIGTISPYPSGGIDITVPNATDEIHMERDDGGNLAKVSLGAEKIVARQRNRKTESVVIDTEAGSITANGSVTATNPTFHGQVTADSIKVNGGVTATTPTLTGQVIADGITAKIATFSSSVTVGSIFTSSDYVGVFTGEVVINGNLTKGGGGFKIDHPLDPANKYLTHSFVESPDMKNIYDGVAVLDEHGEAVVELPAWFEALNNEFRYQLTCIGGYAPVYIAEKVHDNRFKIAGGKPGMEVSWQLTGIRCDAWANAYRLCVEEDKPAEEQGFYLHPELHGASREQHVFAVRHPELAAVMNSSEQGKQEER